MFAVLPHRKSYIAFGHDLLAAAAAFVAATIAAYWIRADQPFIVSLTMETVIVGGVQAAVAAPIFLASRFYAAVWRYASIADLTQIFRATLLVAVGAPAIAFLLTRLVDTPRSALVLNWIFLFGFLVGPRIAYRIWRDRRAPWSTAAASGVPTLIVGATDAAEAFIREMRRSDSAPYAAVGIVDDRGGGRVGREIHQVPVLGAMNDLERIVQRLRARNRGPQRIVVARVDIAPAELQVLVERADALGLTVARLPRPIDFAGSAMDMGGVRPIAIEDLLGRPRTVLDPTGPQALIAGKTVLVTGAGGSIGGELCRRIASAEPARLIMVELSEYALYEIDQELAGAAPETPRDARIADVRDAAQMAELFQAARPDVVFHAAALKHVPLVEDNVRAGVATNALGTRIIAEAARAAGTPLMVMISTDKAINPPNVMGATKRAAERWCQARDRQGAEDGGTRFATVRFGNVLGSTGSVVPLFRRQLAAGGPITVTHPDMQRYFMTIREAVELVLQAAALDAQGREARAPGRIYVLDMGEPVKIVDLARRMIRLAGLRPDADVEIVYTGLRPGEKLFEELFDPNEAPTPTPVPGVLTASPPIGDMTVLETAFAKLADATDDADAIAGLRAIAPEYQPADAGRAA